MRRFTLTARKQQGELFHLQGATESDTDFSPSLVRTIWCTGINGTHSSGGLTNRPCFVYMHMFATVGALGRAKFHAALFQWFVSLFVVALRARGGEIFPRPRSTLRRGNDVIDGEIILRAAVLALEPIPNENIPPMQRHQRRLVSPCRLYDRVRTTAGT